MMKQKHKRMQSGFSPLDIHVNLFIIIHPLLRSVHVTAQIKFL